MVKDSKKKEKQKESPFKKFLKKRAPIYLAVIAIVIIFIVPELSKGDLENKFPQTLSSEEQDVINILMDYNGPNKKGLTVYDAITSQIDNEYPNEKIYDNKKTNVIISVTKLENDEYQVILDFDSYKEDFHYDWNVNIKSKNIEGNDEDSKYIINLVDFYD